MRLCIFSNEPQILGLWVEASGKRNPIHSSRHVPRIRIIRFYLGCVLCECKIFTSRACYIDTTMNELQRETMSNHNLCVQASEAGHVDMHLHPERFHAVYVNIFNARMKKKSNVSHVMRLPYFIWTYDKLVDLINQFRVAQQKKSVQSSCRWLWDMFLFFAREKKNNLFTLSKMVFFELGINSARILLTHHEFKIINKPKILRSCRRRQIVI